MDVNAAEMVKLREELARTTVRLRQEEERRARLEVNIAAMIAFDEKDRRSVDIQIHSLLIQLSEAIAHNPDLENAIFCAMPPDFVPRLRAQLSIERKKRTDFDARTDQGQDYEAEVAQAVVSLRHRYSSSGSPVAVGPPPLHPGKVTPALLDEKGTVIATDQPVSVQSGDSVALSWKVQLP